MFPDAHTTSLSPADVGRLSGAAHLGRAGEACAAGHLLDDGLRVLARNWRVTDAEAALRGELDVVAVEVVTGALVVCEVKTRRDAARFGGALAAVDPRKVARLRRLTRAFLADSDDHWPHVRLDVVAIDLGAHPLLTHLVGVA